MDLKKYLSVSPEVQEAIASGKPVVALESTIISHGMPYPQNVETALNVEKIIRDAGAIPATIAIIKGKETTPFLRARVAELTGGDSLASNIRLVFNNAMVAAKTAVAYCSL